MIARALAWYFALACPLALGLFGSKSKSSSSTVTTTTNIDKRIVSDAGSVAVSGDNVQLEILDGGAIGGALQLASEALAAQQRTAVETLGAARSSYQSAVDSIGQAYADAKGSGFERYGLVAGVLGLVAVAFLVMRK